MPRIVRAALTSLVLWALTAPAMAAPRIPQVPVSGSALATFFLSQGQTINVNADQVDAQRQAVPATTNFQMQVFGSAASTTSVGLYNAALASPTLYPVMPGATGPGWFAVAAFRTSPTRLVVNLFDQNTALQGSSSYLGADASDFAFFANGTGGLIYQQDERNAAGAARMLVFNATGAKTGNTWLAFETSPSGPGDFADAIALVNLALSPVSDAKSTWARVKSLYR
jgi:hypothetical protein